MPPRNTRAGRAQSDTLWLMHGATQALPRILVALALGVLLGLPMIFRPASARVPGDALRLVIISPHNEQIRWEFGTAFSAWHQREHGRPVVLDWRTPGGTTEIRKLLTAQYGAALRTGRITPQGQLRPGDEPMPYDLCMGGGTFEHGVLKRPLKAKIAGSDGTETEISVSMSVPMGFEKAWLDETFGPNTIGAEVLYDPGDPAKNDPGQHWLGTALSGFGIVFNRDVLARLGVEEPDSWDDLANPRLDGWVALADPRQSGSVATAYDAILNNYEWTRGWRTLRAMTANARGFSNSSLKVPLDVSQGEAAVGVCIDFIGRFQAQAMMRPGDTPETCRVGYVDPPGVTFIDPDPISILRAGPNPELARRFVEFVLSDEGQALWQFRSRETLRRTSVPEPPDELGPQRFELRRLPIKRSMFARFGDRMIDRVDPFVLASAVKSKGWRDAVGPMMAAFSIEVHQEQKAAWRALNAARAAGAEPARLQTMEGMFYVMPVHTTKDGQELLFDEASYKAITGEWVNRRPRPEAMIAYREFLRRCYARVTRIGDLSRPLPPGPVTSEDSSAPATGATGGGEGGSGAGGGS